MKKRINKIPKYPTGGIQYVGAAGQGLNALGGPKDTNMQYGSNAYFDQRNKELGMSQAGANAIGTAIPIVGAFKAVGEGGQNLIAKKDAYGVSDSSNAAVAAGGFLNPLEETTSGIHDIFHGKFNGKTAANFILPGYGAVLQNKENKTQRDILQQQSEQSNYAMGGMQYAEGGINAEVEKEENSVAPDGSFTQYDGPNHSQGGIKTNLSPGEIVFSDRLKLGKKTFAELNKINNTNKEDKVLNDSKSNSVKRLTAELMKNVKVKKSMDLFQQQEMLKQSKLNNYASKLGINNNSNLSPMDSNKILSQNEENPEGSATFKNGGRSTIKGKGESIRVFSTNKGNSSQNTNVNNVQTLNKYPYGGREDEQDQIISELNNMNNADSSRNNAINQNSYDTDLASGLSENNTSGNNYSPYINIAKQIGLGLAQNAGNIYDLKNASKVQKEVYNRVTPTLLDPTAALKYNDQQFKVGANAIKQASVGNSSVFIQNRKDLAINQMLTNARILQDYNNQNANITNQANYYNAGVGDNQTIANIQNLARSQDLKSNAYRNIGKNVIGQYDDIQAENRDKDLLGIISEQYPDSRRNPALAKYYQKYGK